MSTLDDTIHLTGIVALPKPHTAFGPHRSKVKQSYAQLRRLHRHEAITIEPSLEDYELDVPFSLAAEPTYWEPSHEELRWVAGPSQPIAPWDTVSPTTKGHFDDRATIHGYVEGQHVSGMPVGRRWTWTWGQDGNMPTITSTRAVHNWGMHDSLPAPRFANLSAIGTGDLQMGAWNALLLEYQLVNQPIDATLIAHYGSLIKAGINDVRFIHRLATLYVVAKHAEKCKDVRQRPGRLNLNNIPRAQMTDVEVQPVATIADLRTAMASGLRGGNFVPTQYTGINEVDENTIEVLWVATQSQNPIEISDEQHVAQVYWPEIPNLKLMLKGTYLPGPVQHLASDNVWAAAMRWCHTFSDPNLMYEAVRYLSIICASPSRTFVSAYSKNIMVSLPLAQMGGYSLGPMISEPVYMAVEALTEPKYEMLLAESVLYAKIISASIASWTWPELGYFRLAGQLDARDLRQLNEAFHIFQGGVAFWKAAQNVFTSLGIKGNIGRLVGTTIPRHDRNDQLLDNLVRNIPDSVQWSELLRSMSRISSASAIMAALYPMRLSQIISPGLWIGPYSLSQGRTNDEAFYTLATLQGVGIELFGRDGTGLPSRVLPRYVAAYDGTFLDHQGRAFVDQAGVHFEPVIQLNSLDQIVALNQPEHAMFKREYFIDSSAVMYPWQEEMLAPRANRTMPPGVAQPPAGIMGGGGIIRPPPPGAGQNIWPPPPIAPGLGQMPGPSGASGSGVQPTVAAQDVPAVQLSEPTPPPVPSQTLAPSLTTAAPQELQRTVLPVAVEPTLPQPPAQQETAAATQLVQPILQPPPVVVEEVSTRPAVVQVTAGSITPQPQQVATAPVVPVQPVQAQQPITSTATSRRQMARAELAAGAPIPAWQAMQEAFPSLPEPAPPPPEVAEPTPPVMELRKRRLLADNRKRLIIRPAEVSKDYHFDSTKMAWFKHGAKAGPPKLTYPFASQAQPAYVIAPSDNVIQERTGARTARIATGPAAILQANQIATRIAQAVASTAATPSVVPQQAPQATTAQQAVIGGQGSLAAQGSSTPALLSDLVAQVVDRVDVSALETGDRVKHYETHSEDNTPNRQGYIQMVNEPTEVAKWQAAILFPNDHVAGTSAPVSRFQLPKADRVTQGQLQGLPLEMSAAFNDTFSPLMVGGSEALKTHSGSVRPLLLEATEGRTLGRLVSCLDTLMGMLPQEAIPDDQDLGPQLHVDLSAPDYVARLATIVQNINPLQHLAAIDKGERAYVAALVGWIGVMFTGLRVKDTAGTRFVRELAPAALRVAQQLSADPRLTAEEWAEEFPKFVDFLRSLRRSGVEVTLDVETSEQVKDSRGRVSTGASGKPIFKTEKRTLHISPDLLHEAVRSKEPPPTKVEMHYNAAVDAQGNALPVQRLVPEWSEVPLTGAEIEAWGKLQNIPRPPVELLGDDIPDLETFKTCLPDPSRLINSYRATAQTGKVDLPWIRDRGFLKDTLDKYDEYVSKKLQEVESVQPSTSDQVALADEIATEIVQERQTDSAQLRSEGFPDAAGDKGKQVARVPSPSVQAAASSVAVVSSQAANIAGAHRGQSIPPNQQNEDMSSPLTVTDAVLANMSAWGSNLLTKSQVAWTFTKTLPAATALGVPLPLGTIGKLVVGQEKVGSGSSQQLEPARTTSQEGTESSSAPLRVGMLDMHLRPT